MYSESDLDAAVAAGAMRADQAHALRDFVAARRRTPVVDEEHFRLLTGFNDIFVAIAGAILLFAVGWIGHAIPPNIDGDGPSPWMGLFVAGTAWGLAEYFTRQRRMALPSILFLLAFVGGTFGGVAAAIATGLGDAFFERNEQAVGVVLAVAAGLGVGAAWLHWRRFKVPITIAAGAAAAVAVVLSLIVTSLAGNNMSDAEEQTLFNALHGVALILGVGVFLFAMWWDGSDRRRETRRSDVAFWLHLLAAPLIVHPVFTLLGLTEGAATVPGGVTVILLYVVLGITALAVDRRALLVSALAYVLYAINNLFQTYGAVELSFALTALVIGSALLLLSAFWTNARRLVVAPLPDGLQGRLPVIDRMPSPRPAA
ncbi:hypothetical protein [Sphingosinicella sp.]|uniref:hypothetical protein n=1 Tax=Sphingosinicella sp. TaxID=1917971 RepID=UPI004037A16A